MFASQPGYTTHAWVPPLRRLSGFLTSVSERRWLVCHKGGPALGWWGQSSSGVLTPAQLGELSPP